MVQEKREIVRFTYLLILLNFLIFLFMISNPRVFLQIVEDYGLKPVQVVQSSHFVSFLSYMFLHGDLAHLIVNTFALWGIGTIVEREIGSTIFSIVYLCSGIVAGLGHVILNPVSDTPLVGASGAIFGILAILFLLMPFKFTMLLIIPLPSVLVGIIMATAEISAFLYSKDPYIAHDAHLVGFISGFISSFIIDFNRAVKGIIIAISAGVVLYFFGIYYNLF